MALLVQEVWEGIRPFVRVFAIDASIFLMLWTMLFGAHELSGMLPVPQEGSSSPSKAALFLLGIHEGMLVLMYLGLGVLTVWDTVQLRRNQHRRKRR